MSSIEEYYRIIRNSTQIVEVELVELCGKKNRIGDLGDSREITLNISKEVGEIQGKIINIYLKVNLTGPNEFFNIDLVYKGICLNVDNINDDETFKEYASNQIVPLLLPYARECISNTLARMQLPIFLIPTMDVLDSLEENKLSE